jgi:purine-binding chemotaxis protein CheW
MEKQLVIFELTNEHFGVDIAAVESIIKMQAITKVPHSPVYIEGVTNLRGKVLPVIDLRKRFGAYDKNGEAGKNGNRRIVVVNMNSSEIGMVVDGVSEVLTISDSLIEPPPQMVMTAETAFITGIVKLDHRLVMLLDLGKILSNQERSDLPFAQ